MKLYWTDSSDRNCNFLTVLKARSLDQVLKRVVSSGSCHLGIWMTNFLQHLHVTFPSVPSFLKHTGQTGVGPTLQILSKLRSLFKCSHGLRYLGLMQKITQAFFLNLLSFLVYKIKMLNI